MVPCYVQVCIHFLEIHHICTALYFLFMNILLCTRSSSYLCLAGRFGKHLEVGPPDAGAREEIFKIHLRGVPCSGDVSVAALAIETLGYTGADIQALCREAALASLEVSALVYLRIVLCSAKT